MGLLHRMEEILLIAIWKLGEEAYGSAIIKQVEKDTDTSFISGAVYGSLGRLVKNRYIEVSREESNFSKSVGRPRIYYRITSTGMKKLSQIQEINKSLWCGIPDLKR